MLGVVSLLVAVALLSRYAKKELKRLEEEELALEAAGAAEEGGGEEGGRGGGGGEGLGGESI